MKWKTVGAAVVLLTSPHVLDAQIREASGPQILVRSYDNVGVPAADLQIARALASSILRDAGIEVTWMDCWFPKAEPSGVPTRCGEPIGSTDLVLRLQARPTVEIRARFVSMGFSLVGSGPRPAFLSTVFVDLVRTVAWGASVDRRQVLGLTIAHEIGHLLLNSSSHASSGLMRAAWSRSELRRNAAADCHFLDDEAAVMRAEVVARGGEK